MCFSDTQLSPERNPENTLRDLFSKSGPRRDKELVGREGLSPAAGEQAGRIASLCRKGGYCDEN